jgi:4-amino-4-deoxy-L-arabinose transferase-like glycosyltransferase
MKKHKKKKAEVDLYTLLLLVLTVAAFVMRVYHLDYLTLWVDEYVHVDRARNFPAEPLLTDDNNGILLTLILLPIFKFFGVGEFAARFPSVVFGTGLVPLAYFFVKRYFNRHAALITAFLVTFSTYLTFWSRLSRNYAIFAFFFLLFLYFFGRAIGAENQQTTAKSRFWKYLNMNPKQLLPALGILVLSALSHWLTYLAIYGILFYYFVLFINSLSSRSRSFVSVEAVVAYLFILFSVIVFVPPVQKIFLQLLPVQIANWGGLPDLTRLAELTKAEPFKIFNLYFGILNHDYPAIYWLGFLGFIYAAIRYRRAGYFLASVFIAVFLVMSFVFREPALPRYLIYIYPLFLVAIAMGFDGIRSFIRKKTGIRSRYIVCTILLLFCMLPTVRNSVGMVMRKSHGMVTDTHFSSFYFPDWKTSLSLIKPHLGENDVLMSTIPAYANFYLNKKSYHFRQRRYDADEHRYVNLPTDTLTPNAASTQAVARLLDNADKAWLAADYYFNNVMTDPETKAYVVNRMKFEYGMSNQYVTVFSYDRSAPNTQPCTLFEYLHAEYAATREYQFEKPETNQSFLLLDAEGVSYDNEMIVQFNQGPSVGVLRSYGLLFNENGDSRSRQIYAVPIPSHVMRPGVNTFRVGLNNNPLYGKCRFALFNMQVQNTDQ